MAHPQMINSTAINTPLKEYQAVPSNQVKDLKIEK